jgi:hypothetical protein
MRRDTGRVSPSTPLIEHFDMSMPSPFAKRRNKERDLFIAAQQKNFILFKDLLKDGYKDTVADKKKRNLLLFCIEYSRYQEARELVLKGARHNTVKPCKAADGSLYYTYPYPPLLALLQKIYESTTYKISRKTHDIDEQVPPLLGALITHAPSVTIKDPSGNTPLHLLAYFPKSSKERVNLAAQLITRGALVSDINNLGRTALFDAVLHGDLDYMRFLIEQGAAINARDKIGRNVLMVYSSEHKDPKKEVAEFLHKQGINTRAEDELGRNVLWYAWYCEKSKEYQASLATICNPIKRDVEPSA